MTPTTSSTAASPGPAKVPSSPHRRANRRYGFPIASGERSRGVGLVVSERLPKPSTVQARWLRGLRPQGETPRLTRGLGVAIVRRPRWRTRSSTTKASAYDSTKLGFQMFGGDPPKTWGRRASKCLPVRREGFRDSHWYEYFDDSGRCRVVQRSPDPEGQEQRACAHGGCPRTGPKDRGSQNNREACPNISVNDLGRERRIGAKRRCK